MTRHFGIPTPENDHMQAHFAARKIPGLPSYVAVREVPGLKRGTLIPFPSAAPPPHVPPPQPPEPPLQLALPFRITGPLLVAIFGLGLIAGIFLARMIG